MSWQRVAAVVAGGSAAALAEALEAEGAVSVEIADAQAGTPGERSVFGEPGSDDTLWPHCRVSALFDEGEDASAAFDRALAASATPSLEAASLDRLQDADWVAQAQRQFAPLHVGGRLWIVPTWHDAPDPAAVNIVLDPGAAFGTGSHPTTRLCLAWLERNVRAGDRVLDYGCGSGILGIAALRLGAASATAVDIDPLALESARYNATRNGVALEVTSADRSLATHARLTVANILANPLRMLAPLLTAHTEPGGRIALAGILESQTSEVADAYAPWAKLAVESSTDGWVLLAGERRS
jgi:ribosomal protein L11 methyltransferase